MQAQPLDPRHDATMDAPWTHHGNTGGTTETPWSQHEHGMEPPRKRCEDATALHGHTLETPWAHYGGSGVTILWVHGETVVRHDGNIVTPRSLHNETMVTIVRP